jgi:hypothetical protein
MAAREACGTSPARGRFHRDACSTAGSHATAITIWWVSSCPLQRDSRRRSGEAEQLARDGKLLL